MEKYVHQPGWQFCSSAFLLVVTWCSEIYGSPYNPGFFCAPFWLGNVSRNHPEWFIFIPISKRHFCDLALHIIFLTRVVYAYCRLCSNIVQCHPAGSQWALCYPEGPKISPFTSLSQTTLYRQERICYIIFAYRLYFSSCICQQKDAGCWHIPPFFSIQFRGGNECVLYV